MSKNEYVHCRAVDIMIVEIPQECPENARKNEQEPDTECLVFQNHLRARISLLSFCEPVRQSGSRLQKSFLAKLDGCCELLLIFFPLFLFHELRCTLLAWNVDKSTSFEHATHPLI